jgi:hypothetical protein
MSFNLASCAHYTLMEFSPIVDLSRSLKTNLIVKFAPLWNVMRSCLKPKLNQKQMDLVFQNQN